MRDNAEKRNSDINFFVSCFFYEFGKDEPSRRNRLKIAKSVWSFDPKSAS